MAADEEIEIAVRLARIEVQLSELVRLNQERGLDHETRLRALERWKYMVPPALLTGLIALLNSIFGGA